MDRPAVMADPAPAHLDAATWLHQLYSTAEDGWLTLFTLDRDTGRPSTDWATVGDIDALAARAAVREPHSCVWFGVATRRQRLDGGRRGGHDDCAALPGLWVDIDIAGPGHRSAGRLARDRAHAHQLVDAFPLAPTAVIDTGGGLQAWWLFGELHDVDEATDKLLAAWGATWNRLADQHGIDLDNVFDLPRIMRLPGTTNRKEDLARPVVATSFDFDRRYGADDFDQYLDDPPAPPRHRTGSQLPYIGPERPGDAYNLRHTGGDILGRHGFTLARTDRNGDEHWVRPGKDAREGSSATVYAEDGHTTIWSSTVASQWPAVEVNRPYDPFGLYAALEHGGRFDEARRALSAAGYGTPLTNVTEVSSLDPAEPWPEPSALPPPPEVAAFPLESLPDFAQAHAVAAAEQVQVPVDLTAMGIIGALSAACTGRARVHASANWSEPVNLYTVVAMRSGAGKSPAEKLTVGWLRRWQKDRIDATKADHDKAVLKVRHAKKKLTKLEGSESVDERDLFAAYDALAAAEAAVPVPPRLLADDATPQAIAMLLTAHGQRLAITSTEADLFDMLLRGKPDQRADMNIYLKAWSGDEYIRDRKGGQEAGPEWSVLTNPLLSISITVQPSVLTKVLTDQSLVSRGFAARFMFAIPADLIGRRDQSRRFGSERLATIDGYEQRCKELADRWGRWANPAHLHLEPAAADTLEAFLVEVEPQLAEGEAMETLAEWVNKLHASIVRYAGLLHLAEGGDPQATISAGTMARAIELGRYWLSHSLAVTALEDDVVATQAQGLLGWIAGEGRSLVTLAEMQAGYRRPGEGLDRIADYVAPVELLIGLGYLRPVDGGDWRADVGIRRAKSPNFAVWPKIVGRPRSAVIPRSPRTAYMGESFSLFPSSASDSLPAPRGTRITRTDDAPPLDDHADGYELGALFDRPGVLPPEPAS